MYGGVVITSANLIFLEDVNKLDQSGVKVGMLKLTILSKLLLVYTAITISSCVQSLSESRNDRVRIPNIVHSSPDVISLHEYENAHDLNDSNSSIGGNIIGAILGSLTDSIFDNLLGSGPDDDCRAGKRKRDFIDKNREAIVKDLESKKD